MNGITIQLHFEDEPMLCAECGVPLGIQAMILQIGEVQWGNLTPIQKLCDECRDRAGTKTSENEQKLY